MVIVFRQQRLAAIQVIPWPLNAAASMHAGAAGTLIHIYLTLTSLKPWNEDADSVSGVNNTNTFQNLLLNCNCNNHTVHFPVNWLTECFIYLASIHSCSYPDCPYRWRCWSRVQSGKVAVAFHSVCQWSLCGSSRSCIWDNQIKRHLWFRNHMIPIIYSISSFCVLKCKIEMYKSVIHNFYFSELGKSNLFSVPEAALLTHSLHLYTEPHFGMASLGTRQCWFCTGVLGNRAGRCKWSHQHSHGNCRHWNTAVIDTHQSGSRK